MQSICQSMSIGIRAVTSVKRHSQINLRKGQFAYVQDYESVFKVAAKVSKFVAFALILLAACYSGIYFIYSKQIKTLKDSFKVEVVKAIPELKRKVKSGRVDFRIIKRDAITELQDRIDRKRAATDSFVRLNNVLSPVDVLSILSKEIPKEVEIETTEYKFETRPDGSGKIRLKVEADSYDTLEKFQKSLLSVKILENISEKSSGTKPGTEIKVAEYEADYTPR